MTAIPYPFGLGSMMMSKQRTQGATFLMYQPRSGTAYVKNTSVDQPVFFNATFKFTTTDAQRFIAWFRGPLDGGRLPFTIPLRTEFGLATQDVRFYATAGDTLLDHSQEGGTHTYTATIFASEIVNPPGIDDNLDFVASPFWALRGEWDLALNTLVPA